MRRSGLVKLFWNSLNLLIISILLSTQCFAATVLQQNFSRNDDSTAGSLGASTTVYYTLGGNMQMLNSATESRKAVTHRAAGTFSNLYINILTNDRAASTFRTRKATANANLVVSITGSTTGKFEDTSNTDAVTAGDDWHCSIVTGAGGTVFTFSTYSVLFAATTNTVMRGGFVELSFTQASSTIPFCIWGNTFFSAGDTDANVGTTYRTAGTLNNLLVNIRFNDRTTTSSFRSRLNSANGGLLISVTGGTSGILEDTANSDTIASGDLVNFAYISGTGTETMAVNGVTADFVSTNGKQMYVLAQGNGQAQTAGLTRYYGFAGRPFPQATESNTIAESNLAFTLSNLQINVTAYTIVGNSTLTLRKNSAAGNSTVSIPGTGITQDTTNSDVIVATDTLNYELVTPSVVTSMTFKNISVVGDSTVAAARRVMLAS